LRKVAEQVSLDGDATLTFEVSDGVRAMQIFVPGDLDVDENVVRVALRPRPASCKPRDRLWLGQEAAKAPASSGCEPTKNAATCCN